MDPTETPQIFAPTPPGHRDDILTGRFGLRAGWGITIFVVFYFILTALLGVATPATRARLREMVAQRQSSGAMRIPSASDGPNKIVTPNDTVIDEGLHFAAVALVAWVLSRIERRRLAVYGIGRSLFGDFLPGAFWGLATLSLLIGILRAAHVLVFDARALTGSRAFTYGAMWLAAFLLVGILEEYLTRGYLQYTLTRGLFGIAEMLSPTHARAAAFWIAAVIMSIVFGAGHIFNPGESTPGIIAVFVAGMVFSYTLWHTGSLWWAIGFHMAWDWAQSFLYGVPDSGILSTGRLFNTHPTGNALLSGGTTGPEGSILVIPTLLLVILIVRFTTRPGIQPALEPMQSLPPDSASVIA
jgi:membrane protease YdiL (CAAX protease family)